MRSPKVPGGWARVDILSGVRLILPWAVAGTHRTSAPSA